MIIVGTDDHPNRAHSLFENNRAIERRFWGSPMIPIDHSMVEFRLVPLPRNLHPPFDLGLQSRFISTQMKRVEPVDDISHQVAHLMVADMRDIGPGNAVSICVDQGHVSPVAGPGDRRLACMDCLEVRVSHTKHRHGLGEFGRDALLGFLVHLHSLMPCVYSGQRLADGRWLRSPSPRKPPSSRKRLLLPLPRCS